MPEPKKATIDFGKLMNEVQEVMPETASFSVAVVEGKPIVTVKNTKEAHPNPEVTKMINDMIGLGYVLDGIGTEGRKADFHLSFTTN